MSEVPLAAPPPCVLGCPGGGSQGDRILAGRNIPKDSLISPSQRCHTWLLYLLVIHITEDILSEEYVVELYFSIAHFSLAYGGYNIYALTVTNNTGMSGLTRIICKISRESLLCLVCLHFKHESPPSMDTPPFKSY